MINFFYLLCLRLTIAGTCGSWVKMRDGAASGLGWELRLEQGRLGLSEITKAKSRTGRGARVERAKEKRRTMTIGIPPRIHR